MSMRNRKAIWSVALLCGIASIAHADVIHLKDGKKIEGKITVQASDVVTIETKFGPMDVKRSLIDRIETQRMPEEEVTARLEEAGTDPAKLWAVAEYAREKKMSKRFKEIAELVVKHDANHRLANEALGKVEFEGKWYTPEGLEEYKTKFAADMQAQGKELIDGVWVDRDTAMQRKGFENYEGEWLRPGEVYRRKSEKLAPELLGVTLATVDSAHFTMRSQLPAEECQEILDLLESGWEHFYGRFQPDELERRIMEHYPIAVYVLPSSSLVPKFIEPGGYMDQLYNPPKGINERYADTTSFAIFLPRPLIVASQGRHLLKDKTQSLTGYISNWTGNVLVRRFKRGGALPGWVEAGMGHYYEARLNGYSTATFIEFLGFEHVEKINNELLTFKDWYEKMAKPEFRASLPSLDALRQTKVEEIDAKGLVKSYFLVRWLMDTDPGKLAQYTRRAFQQNTVTRTMTEEAAAFTEVFQVSSEELEAQFHSWLETQPTNPPPFDS